MKNIYHMPRDHIEMPIIPCDCLLCVFIEEHSRKYKKAVQAFKEFLNTMPHINKYCKISVSMHTKPDDIYIFPYSANLYDLLVRLIHQTGFIKYKYTTMHSYIRTFPICSETPLRYANDSGYIVVKEEITDVIKEY
jgi:hypothetical protein